MAGNLEFIKSASGTSVSSFTVTDCFSAKYDVYKIVLTEFEIITAGAVGRLRLLDSGGTVISASEYDYANLDMLSFGSFSEDRSTNATFINRFTGDTRNIYETGGVALYIYNPYDSSSYTFTQQQNTFFNNGNGGQGTKGIGVHKSAEQISGINFLASAGNIENIAVSVYGVK